MMSGEAPVPQLVITKIIERTFAYCLLSCWNCYYPWIQRDDRQFHQWYLPKVCSIIRVGDWIMVGSHKGKVLKRGVIMTTLVDDSANALLLPNWTLSNQEITKLPNLSKMSFKMTTKCVVMNDIQTISDFIRELLKSSFILYVGEDGKEPFCFLSNQPDLESELTFGCFLGETDEDRLGHQRHIILCTCLDAVQENGSLKRIVEFFCILTSSFRQYSKYSSGFVER
ncbi:hypothetical protein ACH5RR_024083 [Cinchona calisaya]|uniref:Mechanosensitive ion channel MscS domain-containing protein n=1 Tax=Cinchona calisaya TaxID=153742 RepID=A0ABD2ZEB3_9GENT